MSQALSKTAPLIVTTNEIETQLNFFNVFLGFKEIKNKLDRIDHKLKNIRFASDILQRRYAFATTLTSLYNRRRVSSKFNLSDPNIYRTLSTIASINAAAQSLRGDDAKARFRAQILESLKPDRDFRTIEHELRCFVHLRQNHCSTQFPDLENLGRYDFLATKNGTQFEIECKTISEDMGNPITTDNSIIYFNGFYDFLQRTTNEIESGIVELALDNNHRATQSEITSILTNYFERPSFARKRFNDIELSFEPKKNWLTLARNKRHEQIQEEMAETHSSKNGHLIYVMNRNRLLAFHVYSLRPKRLVSRIIDVANSASRQFSGHRPALIWLHFLGLTEQEFQHLSQEAKSRDDSPLNRISVFLYRKPERSHIKQIFFSADTDAVRRSRSFDPLYGDTTNFVSNGAVYQTTSLRCRFTDDLPI